MAMNQSPFSTGRGVPMSQHPMYMRSGHTYGRGLTPSQQAIMQQQALNNQNQIVTPQKLQELVRQIDPSEQLDNEVAGVCNLALSTVWE
jgi:hypothetical protein